MAPSQRLSQHSTFSFIASSTISPRLPLHIPLYSPDERLSGAANGVLGPFIMAAITDKSATHLLFKSAGSLSSSTASARSSLLPRCAFVSRASCRYA